MFGVSAAIAAIGFAGTSVLMTCIATESVRAALLRFLDLLLRVPP